MSDGKPRDWKEVEERKPNQKLIQINVFRSILICITYLGSFHFPLLSWLAFGASLPHCCAQSILEESESFVTRMNKVNERTNERTHQPSCLPHLPLSPPQSHPVRWGFWKVRQAVGLLPPFAPIVPYLSPTFQLVQWITNAGSPLLPILPVVHFLVLVRLTAHALTVLLPNKRGKKLNNTKATERSQCWRG